MIRLHAASSMRPGNPSRHYNDVWSVEIGMSFERSSVGACALRSDVNAANRMTLVNSEVRKNRSIEFVFNPLISISVKDRIPINPTLQSTFHRHEHT